MKRHRILIGVATLLAIAFALTLIRPAWTQGSDLALSLRRDWGFGMAGQIQGLFTMSVRGPQEIASVSFELDGKEIALVTQPPFQCQFNTDKYPLGKHSLSATAQTSDGRALKSNTFHVDFVSAEAGWRAAQGIIIPLVVVVGGFITLTIAAPLVVGRKQNRRFEPGKPRNYGVAGGAICPRCGRPFALSLLAPHLVTRKLARCPYCGKWNLVARAPRGALAAAEKAELEASAPISPEPDPAEKLRQQIEESRYQ